MAAQASVRLALLGGFRLGAGRRTIDVAASGQRLIALLALRDRPAARLYVAGTLWPDYPTARSLADLRTTLWRLNQLAEPIVEVSHSCLGLGEHVDVDVRRLIAFTQRLHTLTAEPGQIDLDSVELAELCGELLPDWYEEWLVDERERLRQIRLHALERLSGLLSQAGRHSDAIQAALAAIRLEPLRETAHRTLIEAHLAEGNWSEARRQFRRCERLFQEELGVEPTASMRRLLEARPPVPRQPVLSGPGLARLARLPGDAGRRGQDLADLLHQHGHLVGHEVDVALGRREGGQDGGAANRLDQHQAAGHLHHGLDGRPGVEDLRRPVHQAAETARDRGELPGAVFREGSGLRQRHPIR